LKIAIYGRDITENYFTFIKFLLSELKKNDVEIFFYQPFFNFLKNKVDLPKHLILFKQHQEIKNIDYLISIGGDGTLLDTVSLVQNSEIPILGINTGRLGFLSSITTEEVAEAIKNILSKNYVLEPRILLEINSSNEEIPKNSFALNEITLQKNDTSSMITIHAYINEVFLNSYWADGLIIATPTGSTAYSLSCNGPIIFPNSGNIILNPIAPHNLNVRPLVVPDNSIITLKMEGRTDNVLVAIDSKSKAINVNSTITIKKAKHHINLMQINNHNFLTTLRNKLNWGADKRN